MNALDAARRIAGRFDEDGIAYAIGAALALGVWGVPRATKDVDLTAFVEEDRLGAVLGVFCMRTGRGPRSGRMGTRRERSRGPARRTSS